ncbi:metallo-beta-lactamase family protein [Bradyrhizobium japonicum]|uniref:Metallo-beta-lactamase family protein n=1 Tax=Bradyrhizobium elkanii TaxID=29448 RepID=A0ABV4FC69_BRAEL|nr:MBL fold metallo-hydrolase [Bradyrhizobium elkanii]MBP2431817.1 metallo-beta-lactamase family protein [Bradyrhizobium elkanii]MCP1735112.1 metallo-beta-lactamase family protein [Bradyrhizobium elkanii]MCP1752654.1 metallo-beta-lactamase family protein [Bradyrhizobium elkanii]MCP1978427.1 metallo-beta-lactamase family protein [Bradyrhizobium elkanii]MCS3570453.1 metallo-beta-lactamase family protein [Bradyrhizobium elkanii]
MSITVQFCGAARTVTGSCYLFDTPTGRLLVDCGLFQGPKTLKGLNYAPFPFPAEEIGAVLLTHAHIDHSGLLPKLRREGFSGPIMATRGTIDLCSYMLPDAGNIQEAEVAALNRRNTARGRDEVKPIYTQADAIATLDAFRPVEYRTWFEAMPGVRARYWNAGHLLGSASIEIEFAGQGAGGMPLRVLASGDLGPDAKLLEPDPEAPAGFDYVISESTYGDGDRPATTASLRRAHLAQEVRDAAAAKGALLIPAFAVERTQELIVDLVYLMERGEIPTAPIFLDSPLAIRATEVFRKHAASFDAEVDVDRLLASPQLRFTETVDESKSIARLSGFHIIIAASGMCEAGRIRHHLKRWLWRREATVLLVGFQAQGTLGRFLHDGAKAVRIQGDEVKVAARIRYLDEYSGHADGPELARWIASRRPIHRGVFITHGEEPALKGLVERIAERTIPTASIFNPVLDDIYELSTAAPTPLDVVRRRRLAPDAVVNLDWHNDMSRLLLDINEQIEAAADDRARGVIIRRLRRALEQV